MSDEIGVLLDKFAEHYTLPPEQFNHAHHWSAAQALETRRRRGDGGYVTGFLREWLRTRRPAVPHPYYAGLYR